MKIKEPFIFNEKVQPMCLPSEESLDMNYENSECFASGWGMNDKDTTKLQWIKGQVLSDSDCKKSQLEGYYCDKKYVIQFDSSNIGTVCNGDSGGPMICLGKDQNATIIGIARAVIMENPLCSGKYPEMFERVAYHLDWIKKNMEPQKLF